MCSRASRGRRRSPTACRARARPSCRSRWSISRRPSCAPISRASDPISGRPFMQEVIEGLTAPARRGGPEGRLVRALDAAAAARPTPRTICSSLFIENHWTDFLPITLPTEERVAAMLKGTSHKPDEVVGRMRPTVVPRVLGIHRREGRGERRDGRRAAGIFPGDPRARRERSHRAVEQHHLDGEHRRRQRPDPQRDRDEFRHRRDGPLQPRQRHDRPRLQPAVAESPGRIGAGRILHGHARQPARLQRLLRRERGAQPVGAAARAEGLQARATAPSACSSACATSQEGYGPRETWQEKMRRCLCRRRAFPAAPGDGPDRGAAVRRARHRHQAAS